MSEEYDQQQEQQQQEEYQEESPYPPLEEATRFTFNAIPYNSVESKKHMIIPLSCIHTPLAPGATRLPYAPLVCRGPGCRSIISPYSMLDVKNKMWTCPFCFTRNAFPAQYSEISETNLPAELFPQYSTVEYTLTPPSDSVPPVFLFLVDITIAESELRPLKDTLLQALSLLPQNALVGLITVGTTVQVYELGFTACPKAYVFSGLKDYSAQQVQELLGLPKAPQPAPGAAPAGAPATAIPLGPEGNGFLAPLSKCEFTLTDIIEDLQQDPWPVRADKRPLQSAGAGLSLGIGLLESACRGNCARVMGFIGNPCTQGPGLIVSDDLKEFLRSHSDIVKDKAKHARKAKKFYDGLAQRATACGHAVDLFCCSIDQVGLFEMQDLCRRTGGLTLVADGFAKDTFTKTLIKFFDHRADVPDAPPAELATAAAATLEVHTSKEIKVCGAIGHLASLGNASAPNVSEAEIGIGGTNAWRACSIDQRSSYALFFEISSATAAAAGGAQKPQTPALFQFVTQYATTAGQKILRVCTVARPWTDTAASLAQLADSFDEEAAAAIIARQAAARLDYEDPYDVLRWIDRMLIRLVSKFSTFTPNDPSSLRLSERFTLFPQFMFHLRRSQFVQPFNNTPDESVFYRHCLNRENVPNEITMIQPSLDMYSIESAEPTPVLLSATSVSSQHILLLDTFFLVLVFLGHDIVEARKEGLAEKPEGAAFKNFLAQPIADAQPILADRFPYPRYIECAQYSGDARHLLSILDPAVTHNTQNPSAGEAILTEDVSLQVFIEHLKRAAVHQ